MNISQKRKLSSFSTFGIGGEAKFFIEVFTQEQMQEAFAFAQQEKSDFFLLGSGSNVLFDDKGFSGVVIKNRIDFIQQEENMFHVGSGAKLPKLSKMSVSQNFKGFEFGFGIPASIGGALFMNAGAYGQSLADTLISVNFMHPDGSIQTFVKNELQFGYRYSTLQEKKGAILSASFTLEKDPTVQERLSQQYQKRKLSQPLEAKSIGCIFRNPSPTLSAGKLIEECGLKNAKFGDAVVSEKHANFIINVNQATSCDVQALISHIKQVVWEKKQLQLHEEIRYLPYER